MKPKLGFICGFGELIEIKKKGKEERNTLSVLPNDLDKNRSEKRRRFRPAVSLFLTFKMSWCNSVL